MHAPTGISVAYSWQQETPEQEHRQNQTQSSSHSPVELSTTKSFSAQAFRPIAYSLSERTTGHNRALFLIAPVIREIQPIIQQLLHVGNYTSFCNALTKASISALISVDWLSPSFIH